MRNHRLGKTSRLQQRCDKEFSSLIREKGFCEKCGVKGIAFDTAHIINRKNLTLRWDIMNALCLCRECHQFAHANPTEFTKWFKAKYKERYEYLQRAKNIILFRIEDDYEVLLKNILDRNFWSLVNLSID